MKTTRLLVLLAITLAARLPVFADVVPSIEFIVLDKQHDFNQTGPSTVTEDTARPFRFKSNVDGPLQSASFPAPLNQITSTPPGSLVSGILPFLPPDSDDQWHYSSPTYSTPAALNADYAGGSYSLLIGGQAITLSMPVGNLGNDFLYPNTPIVTAINATWLPNGTLLYDASSGPLTLFSNTYSVNAGSSAHLGLHLSPTSGQPSNFSDFDAEIFGSGPANICQTYSNPCEFVTGTTYQVELEFNNIVDGLYDVSALFGQTAGTAQAAAVYTSRTQFNLLVIPEPSTYAALAGVGALALAVWRRRNQK